MFSNVIILAHGEDIKVLSTILNVGFAPVDRESDQLVGISSESTVSQVNIGYIFRQILGENLLPQALSNYGKGTVS